MFPTVLKLDECVERFNVKPLGNFQYLGLSQFHSGLIGCFQKFLFDIAEYPNVLPFDAMFTNDVAALCYVW